MKEKLNILALTTLQENTMIEFDNFFEIFLCILSQQNMLLFFIKDHNQ